MTTPAWAMGADTTSAFSQSIISGGATNTSDNQYSSSYLTIPYNSEVEYLIPIADMITYFDSYETTHNNIRGPFLSCLVRSHAATNNGKRVFLAYDMVPANGFLGATGASYGGYLRTEDSNYAPFDLGMGPGIVNTGNPTSLNSWVEGYLPVNHAFVSLGGFDPALYNGYTYPLSGGNTGLGPGGVSATADWTWLSIHYTYISLRIKNIGEAATVPQFANPSSSVQNFAFSGGSPASGPAADIDYLFWTDGSKTASVQIQITSGGVNMPPLPGIAGGQTGMFVGEQVTVQGVYAPPLATPNWKVNGSTSTLGSSRTFTATTDGLQFVELYITGWGGHLGDQTPLSYPYTESGYPSGGQIVSARPPGGLTIPAFNYIDYDIPSEASVGTEVTFVAIVPDPEGTGFNELDADDTFAFFEIYDETDTQIFGDYQPKSGFGYTFDAPGTYQVRMWGYERYWNGWDFYFVRPISFPSIIVGGSSNGLVDFTWSQPSASAATGAFFSSLPGVRDSSDLANIGRSYIPYITGSRLRVAMSVYGFSGSFDVVFRVTYGGSLFEEAGYTVTNQSGLLVWTVQPEWTIGQSAMVTAGINSETSSGNYIALESVMIGAPEIISATPGVEFKSGNWDYPIEIL